MGEDEFIHSYSRQPVSKVAVTSTFGIEFIVVDVEAIKAMDEFSHIRLDLEVELCQYSKQYFINARTF